MASECGQCEATERGADREIASLEKEIVRLNEFLVTRHASMDELERERDELMGGTLYPKCKWREGPDVPECGKGNAVVWCPTHRDIMTTTLKTTNAELVAALEATRCSTFACTTNTPTYEHLCQRCAALKRAGAAGGEEGT